jgi:hypothetical protein
MMAVAGSAPAGAMLLDFRSSANSFVRLSSVEKETWFSDS